MTEITAGRCFIVDPPTDPIRIGLFTGDGGSTIVTIDALRAVNIAGELLTAARRRLTDGNAIENAEPRILPNERQALPNRRMQAKHRVELAGTTLFIGIGFDRATGRPCEVFVTGGKEGTDLQLLVQHVAIVISIALQHGAEPAALKKTLARADATAGWAALLVPAIVDLLIAEMPT